MQNFTPTVPVRVAASVPNSPAPFQPLFVDTPMENYCARLTHKEYVALQTIEYIPEILKNSPAHQPKHVNSPTLYFSPTQLPLQYRMAEIFRRSMQRARMEVNQGTQSSDAAAASEVARIGAGNNQQQPPLEPGDVMSEEEVNDFVDNIETFHMEGRGGTSWFRRYYRVIKPGEVRPETVLPTMGETVPEFVLPLTGQGGGARPNSERVAIAVLELNKDGIAVGGWWKLPNSEMRD